MGRTAEPINVQPQLEGFAEEVRTHYGERFEDVGARFRGSKHLLKRFDQAWEAVRQHGLDSFSQVYETHNELCIADRILSSHDPLFSLLEYEPKLKRCRQSIDFRAASEEGLVVFIDVKTIKPEAKDWRGRFEKAQAKGRFPERVHVIHSKDQLGGKLWRYDYRSREKFLAYTLKLEDKIKSCGVTSQSTFFVMAFCGTGFEWHEDDLEDFVIYYRKGSYRPDDPFGRMEMKYVRDKRISIDRSVSRFAYMRRSIWDIAPKSLNWNVQAPEFPKHGLD